jgi:hypothetical protein
VTRIAVGPSFLTARAVAYLAKNPDAKRLGVRADLCGTRAGPVAMSASGDVAPEAAPDGAAVAAARPAGAPAAALEPPRDGERGREPEPAQDGGAEPGAAADHDELCRRDLHCRLCPITPDTLVGAKHRSSRAAGCCGARPCMATRRELVHVVQVEALHAARASAAYARKAARGEDTSACCRFQSYRLLVTEDDVKDDDRSGGGVRVQLNACLVRFIQVTYPARRQGDVTGFKRAAGDGGNASPKRPRR